ncbi:Band 4.1 domain-containing protein [Cavenderia fasciculata]|uniref:Band 4.1 domain-containing protein n=1 Tax=Cavenderia fasciculata TaxID=261658 RepID=F4QBL5_CACFS|nr:Band 4.1 domain-containing protein [Cavenderia fasciculata]EGG14603.1 Band 4.1 domain-containing protein [Cavenderia fasciculata]|eukprot:XP_004351111.1 Band 4.1 domain-containing protein [Cavenderia fasciculata]
MNHQEMIDAESESSSSSNQVNPIHHDDGSSKTSSPSSSSPNVAMKPNQVILRIYFIDDTHKTLSIDPNTINGEQLWDMVSEKVGINNRDAECFFVWAQSDEIEWLLYNHQKISDVINNWNAIKSRYIDNPNGADSPPLSPGATLKKLTPTLGRKSSSLLESLRGSKKEKEQSKSMSTAVAIEHKSNKVHASFPTLGEVGMFRLVYRATSVLPLQLEKNVSSPEAIHLLYIQAVHHVVQSNYPCEEDIAVKLASIQLQVNVGDNKQEHTMHLRESLNRYIPQHLVSKHTAAEWENIVLPQHVLLRGSNISQLKKAYLESCQRWIYYQSTFFNAKFVPVNTSFFTQDFEGRVRIGINSYGFHIIDPKVMKIVSHNYKDIICWDNTSSSFSIQVMTTNKQNAQKSYMFKTTVGELINDLLHDWHADWEVDMKKN